MLCLLVISSSVTRPVLAANEIQKQRDEGVASASVGALALGTAGGGIMSAGAGAIAPAALPVLAFVVTAGLLWYTVDGLCNTVGEIWDMLSDTAKAECQEIADSGVQSFAPSENLTNELNNAIDNIFFPDGDFVSRNGFDYSSAIPYASTAVVAGDVLSFDNPDLALFHRTSNGTTTWQKLASGFYSTTHPYLYLTQKSVDVNGTYQYALSFSQAYANGSGAINGYLVPTDFAIKNSSSIWYACSNPVVRYDAIAGAAIPLLGFYLLEVCGLLEAGKPCTHADTHDHTYQSHWVGEDVDKPMNVVINNSGVAALTGNSVVSQKRTAYGNYDYVLDHAANGYTAVRMPKSILAALLANAGALALDAVKTNDYEKPIANVPIYQPGIDVLNELKNLTQQGTKTNDWSKTNEDVKVDTGVADTPVDTPEDTQGFWKALWGWLQRLLDAIVAIPGTIVSAINQIYVWIRDGVIEALRACFIPYEGFFDDYFANLQASFSDRFGILTYPLSVIYDFMNTLADVGDEEPVLSWNSWSYQGTEFIKAGSYNLNDLLDTPIFKTIHNIYYTVTDAFLIFAFLRFLQRKYQSVIMH